jgi:hypothetical protein
MERAMGIEPTSEAWEASILPLYDARFMHYASKTLVGSQGSYKCELMAGRPRSAIGIWLSV